MINNTLNFAGQNSLTLKQWRGIYRVLCCWQGGRFFLLLWASHFSKRLLRAWPVRLRKSVQFPWCHRRCHILMPWSNWGFTAPPLRVLQERDTAPLEISHIQSIPPVCTSKVPHCFFSWCKRCPYYDCKLHEADYFQRSVWGSMGHRLSPRCFCDHACGPVAHCKAPVARTRGALSGGGFPGLEAAATPKS